MFAAESTILQLNENNLVLVDKIRTKYASTLTYGWKANHNKTYDQGHWNKSIIANSKRFPCDYASTPVIDKHPEIKTIWMMLRDVIGPRGLYRCYVNGYTFGTDGYAHQDDRWLSARFGADAAETAILYLNPTWDIDWGGETVVFENLTSDDNDIVESVLPKFGRIFVFPSDKLHASRPLSRICGVLRSVFVVKTFDSNIVSPQVKFILNATKDVKHSGRTFFEHLFGTMLKLEAREDKETGANRVSDDVLLAGLYHAVYGTEYFNYNNANINRDTIKNLIGEYAESLVYEFCTMKNRIGTMMTNSNNYDPKVLSDLIKMEIGNLKDQSSKERNNSKILELETKLLLLPA